mmetsp:Transcript_44788/g.91425  ORF Transcript_44788/g.91425 Transcript_44788/m.91425 type:complete len:222 (+) Transcript_44788:900-1565(+)
MNAWTCTSTSSTRTPTAARSARWGSGATGHRVSSPRSRIRHGQFATTVLRTVRPTFWRAARLGTVSRTRLSTSSGAKCAGWVRSAGTQSALIARSVSRARSSPPPVPHSAPPARKTPTAPRQELLLARIALRAQTTARRCCKRRPTVNNASALTVRTPRTRTTSFTAPIAHMARDALMARARSRGNRRRARTAPRFRSGSGLGTTSPTCLCSGAAPARRSS